MREEMEEFVVHLLALSHVYVVPQLKRECENKLEHGLLTRENVVDIFQLALFCDAPRLSLICHRMILKNFKTICTTKGWKVIKKSHVKKIIDGCRTMGPSDKDFKENEAPCKYVACKGLELLVRHFAGCKLRVSGGCIHCKRMWQLLELHSRLCANSHTCRVPLCRNFKGRIKRQSKKD